MVFRCATQEIPCRIEKILSKMDSSTLEKIDGSTLINETEVCEVIMNMKAHAVVDDFNHVPELGRFALEKNREIVAGGINRIK